MSCTRQHVVVTGASSGIGRSTALRLASAGWHVYAGVRRAADGEALQAASSGGQLSPLLMDVTVAEQIDAAVGIVGEHIGAAGLDGLVDNAGIGVASPVEMVPLDALRQQLQVNVVGQIAVTQAFLPLLRRAAGRIVVIASIGDRFTPPFGGPLAASKAAIATLADALRQEEAPWGIKVVMIEPASINSGAADKLERDAKKAIDEFGADGARLYRDAYLGMVKAALSRERRGSPPTVVADLVLKVLTMARPHARNVGGKGRQDVGDRVPLASDPGLGCAASQGFRASQAGFAGNIQVRVKRKVVDAMAPMEMPNQDQVQALDPVFGKMAVELGQHAWSLPQLTMRVKSFVFLAADLCTANLGFPLLTHVQMAGFNGVTPAECAAGIRHLAPYVGYPTAAVALQQLRQQGPMGEEPAQAVEPQPLPGHIGEALDALDKDFARFVTGQFHQRWAGDQRLTPRERALSCLAADVLNQTLDESFAMHVELALAAGAGPAQLEAVLLLVAEYGIPKAWRAYRALDALTA